MNVCFLCLSAMTFLLCLSINVNNFSVHILKLIIFFNVIIHNEQLNQSLEICCCNLAVTVILPLNFIPLECCSLLVFILFTFLRLVLMILYCYIKKLFLVAFIQVPYFKKALSTLLPWTMAHHYNTRIFAQTAVVRLWEQVQSLSLKEVETQYFVVPESIQFMFSNR